MEDSMADDTTIDQLQRRIDDLEQEQDALRESVAQAQLEQWEGRLEDLEVQATLGGMELRDRIEPIIEQGRQQLAEARRALDGGASTASEAAAAARKGIEQAWADLRAAFADVREIVTR
jgi:hypothetical protein